MAAVVQDWRVGRYPWQLLVAVVCWVVVAVSLLTSQIGVPTPTDADAQRDTLNDAGTVVSTTAQDNWFVPLLPWLGVVVVLLAVALLLAQGWSRIPLAACGLIAVVGLALGAAWQVFPAMAGFLVGSVFLVLLPTHRYLQGPRQDDSAVGPPAESTERTVTP
ncbi:hypothetical protein [Actinomycetospora corticicola]|uniref:Putative membrane protein n=1 Tax=Actinomycetospora corticicola TaxID=663602 RepID=A0A7Y9J809_9PSEU|nr:hypothetical protein [Actinomycetospora corticicola]NYD38798.1 putative membrane protein [Actinomycetospora corticicola]